MGEDETFVGGETNKAAGRAPIDPEHDLTLSLGRKSFHQAGVGQDLILQFKRSIKLTAAVEIVSDKSQRPDE